jgi:hypothetical protein
MGHSVLDSMILVVLPKFNILKQITIIIAHIQMPFLVITVPHGFSHLLKYMTKAKLAWIELSGQVLLCLPLDLC